MKLFLTFGFRLIVKTLRSSLKAYGLLLLLASGLATSGGGVDSPRPEFTT